MVSVVLLSLVGCSGAREETSAQGLTARVEPASDQEAVPDGKFGFTPQYEGLEAPGRKYGDRGFEVIAFPCNQFRKQEPGSAEEIASFCVVNFGLSFPLMGKIDVNGADADPLYDWLKAEAPGVFGSKGIKWNFTKFLIGRDGKVVRRYAPTNKPASLEKDIEFLL